MNVKSTGMVEWFPKMRRAADGLMSIERWARIWEKIARLMTFLRQPESARAGSETLVWNCT